MYKVDQRNLDLAESLTKMDYEFPPKTIESIVFRLHTSELKLYKSNLVVIIIMSLKKENIQIL